MKLRIFSIELAAVIVFIAVGSYMINENYEGEKAVQPEPAKVHVEQVNEQEKDNGDIR